MLALVLVLVLVVGALSEEGEAARLQLEVVRVVQPPHEIVELVRRDVGDLAAPVADQVLVGLRQVKNVAPWPRWIFSTNPHSCSASSARYTVDRRDRGMRHLQPAGDVVDRQGARACSRAARSGPGAAS